MIISSSEIKKGFQFTSDETKELVFIYNKDLIFTVFKYN